MKRSTVIATLTICVLSGWFAVELDGQRPRPAELRRIDRVVERLKAFDPSIDRRIIEAASRAVKGRGPWDREQAIARVEGAVAKVNLKQKDREFDIEPARAPFNFFSGADDYRRTPAVFVDFLVSRARLEAVLDELGGKQDIVQQLPTRGEPLANTVLNARLQSLGVSDADAVTASFDWRGPAPIHVLRLDKSTPLLRLSGGTSNAVGRYYFCCDQRAQSPTSGGLPVRWTDATDLALPPSNRAERLTVVTVPAGTLVIVGVVTDNFATKVSGPVRGGNTQIFVPEPKPGWLVEHFVLQSQPPNPGEPSAVPAEVVLWHDGRLVRFRAEQN